MKWSFVFSLSISVVLFSQLAPGKVVGIFDFDSTIVRDRGPCAAWITPWILKRIEKLHTPFQQIPNAPVLVTLTAPEQIKYFNQTRGSSHPLDTPVRVSLELPDQMITSYDEYIQLEPYLAKGEAILGGLSPMLLSYDPIHPDRELLIVPGYYRTFDLTFKYYRESTSRRGTNYIKRDLLAARARTQALGECYSWQGEAFPLFQAFMANEITVPNVLLSTSRGHKAKDYHQLWDEMVRGGEINFAKGPKGERPLPLSLSRPESRIFGRTIAHQKVEVVKQKLAALYHDPENRHWVVNSTGGALRQTLIVPEDDPHYVDAIAQFLIDATGNYYADRVEIVLLNTGTEDEVRAARFPYRWTRFEPGRRARSATPEEIANWLDPQFHLQSMAGTCERLLL